MANGTQDAPDLFDREHGRKSGDMLAAHGLEHRPFPVQDLLKEKLQSDTQNPHGGACEVTLVESVQCKSFEIILGGAARAVAEPFAELANLPRVGFGVRLDLPLIINPLTTS